MHYYTFGIWNYITQKTKSLKSHLMYNTLYTVMISLLVLISSILSSSSGVDVQPLRVLALARPQYTPLECDLGLNPACLIRANLSEHDL